MIVYSDRTVIVDPGRRLRELRAEVRALYGSAGAAPGSSTGFPLAPTPDSQSTSPDSQSSTPDYQGLTPDSGSEAGGPWPRGGLHDRVVAALIELSELEVGVVDELCREVDDTSPLERAWRRAATLAGHALRSSWRGDWSGARTWLERLEGALRSVEGHRLPAEIRVGVQEGYAYYGLYPETFLMAAEEFNREVSPRGVVCIGVRSIGAGLAAVVAAEIEAAGCPVRSYTVRPRGHPFDRRLLCSEAFGEAVLGGRGPELDQAGAVEMVAELSDGMEHFAIVDEGPGLSGSSLMAVAEWLAELGVPDDRVVIIPSWRCDGSRLLSARARTRWPRHRHFVGSFESCFLESGRLGRGLPEGEWVDLSAGRWRQYLYREEAEYPAVQPQHERRKYLVTPADGSAPFLLEFVGLGRYGRDRVELGGRLAEAGFAPPLLGWRSGFMVSEFRAGDPVRTDEIGPEFVSAVARYLAWRARNCAVERVVPFDELVEMIRINLAEGLESEVALDIDSLDDWRELLLGRGTIAIDGRLAPHEWIRTSNGYLKADGVGHHDDHFFPGCQDIAWDLVGAIIECRLDEDAGRALVAEYIALSEDPGAARVLPFYRIAYLAFRLGYALLAVEAVGPGADRSRWQESARYYRAQLELVSGR